MPKGSRLLSVSLQERSEMKKHGMAFDVRPELVEVVTRQKPAKSGNKGSRGRYKSSTTNQEESTMQTQNAVNGEVSKSHVNPSVDPAYNNNAAADAGIHSVQAAFAHMEEVLVKRIAAEQAAKNTWTWSNVKGDLRQALVTTGIASAVAVSTAAVYRFTRKTPAPMDVTPAAKK